jgi:hypothetical protein
MFLLNAHLAGCVRHGHTVYQEHILSAPPDWSAVQNVKSLLEQGALGKKCTDEEDKDGDETLASIRRGSELVPKRNMLAWVIAAGRLCDMTSLPLRGSKIWTRDWSLPALTTTICIQLETWQETETTWLIKKISLWKRHQNDRYNSTAHCCELGNVHLMSKILTGSSHT